MLANLINAFFLMKCTRQEEAGHGAVLLCEKDKILANSHGTPADKISVWFYIPVRFTEKYISYDKL